MVGSTIELRKFASLTVDSVSLNYTGLILAGICLLFGGWQN